MQYSGLVLTFSPDSRDVHRILEEIQSAEVFTLGDLRGHRLVLALESSSPVVAEYWYGWLARLKGVSKVDIAFVSIEDGAREDCKELDHAS